MTKIVLWRHGVTDWNEQGIFQGRMDIPLNERGLRQAMAAAPSLAAMHPVALYTSPMLRALQTAAVLAAITGQKAVTDDRLSEIDVGTWTGHTLAAAIADDPEVRAAVMAGVDYRRSPTGETMTEVGVRAGGFLHEVAARHDGKTIVVVSHGGAIRMGIASMLDWPYDTAVRLGGLANCGWCVLEQRYGRWRIEGYNCTAAPPDPDISNEI